ncbi:MAG: extracellular solute-binding protein [Treponema sp.]|nr:extracellular solute-binding protein [Treponema sp.]
MKKLLITVSVLLVFVPLVFSGGGQAGGTSTGSTAAANKGWTPWFEGRDFSKHYDIDFASVQVDANRDYNKGDEWVKRWTDTFNITWNLTPLTWDNWNERLRIWINSGDAPDMFVLNYNHGEAVNYAEQGMVKRLPDNWKTKYPNLAKASTDSPLGQMAEELLGGTYYLYRPIFSLNRPSKKLSNHMSLYIRKDWGQAAGYPPKPLMKLSEIVEYGRRVKAADPGKIGPGFAPIMIRSGNLGALVHYNSTYAGAGTDPFYKGRDGKYHWGAADPETLEALKILNTAYREGILDREFYTIQDPDDTASFHSTGRSAVTTAEGMAAQMNRFARDMKQNLGLNFADAVEMVTVLGEDGYTHHTPLTNYWGVIAFSPDIDEEKLDRILQMFDYSCTEQGQLEIRCGIETKDWKLEPNREITSFLGAERDFNQVYAVHPVYGNMMILSDDFQFRNPGFELVYREKAKEMYLLREQHSTEASFPSEPDWNVVLHSSRALNLASMVYADEYSALIVKPGDIEANWRAWVREKMALIQPVLDELNAK